MTTLLLKCHAVKKESSKALKSSINCGFIFICVFFSLILWVNVNHEIESSIKTRKSNQISRKVPISLNLQKLILMKINESTLSVFF